MIRFVSDVQQKKFLDSEELWPIQITSEIILKYYSVGR